MTYLYHLPLNVHLKLIFIFNWVNKVRTFITTRSNYKKSNKYLSLSLVNSMLSPGKRVAFMVCQILIYTHLGFTFLSIRNSWTLLIN